MHCTSSARRRATGSSTEPRTAPPGTASGRIVRGFALAAAAFGAGPAAALSVNPIGPGLGLDIHARAVCMHVSSANAITDDAQALAQCAGIVVGQSPNGTTSLPGNSNATARLADGTLAVEVVSRSVSAGQDSVRAGGMAHAYLFDTLTVQGNFTGPRVVELKLDVDGRFVSPVANARWVPSNVIAGLSTYKAGSSAVAFGALDIGVGNDGVPAIASNEAFGAMTVTANTDYIFDPNDVRVSFTYTFTATPTDRTFSFLAQLRAVGGIDFQTAVDPGSVAEGRIDFGNTARLSLVVPGDVTVTSASGVFLTPVPEPPAALLLAAGAALLALRRRRAGAAAPGSLR